MAYATLTEIRQLSSLSTADISDADLTAFIVESDKWVREKISTEVVMENLEGNIDGSNVYFLTKNKAVADIDASGVIDQSDITVYRKDWDSTKEEYVVTSVAVTSLDGLSGIVELTAAPTTSNAEGGVFANYRYYKSGRNPDFARVNMASSYFACFLAACKIYGHTPSMYTTSNMMVTKGLPGSSFLDQATRLIESLVGSKSTFARRVEADAR